jgi:hypothetical protein
LPEFGQLRAFRSCLWRHAHTHELVTLTPAHHLPTRIGLGRDDEMPVLATRDQVA